MNIEIPEYFQEILDFLIRLFQFTIFHINETPVTLVSIFLFGFVFACFFVASVILNRWVFRKLLAKIGVDEGIRFTILQISHYLIILVGTVFSMQFVGIDLGGLAIIFGLLSVGIGFGLQNITANFVSGVILLFERPIEVGDRVTVGELEGDVTAINMRATTVQTMDNISIIVPNSDFTAGKVTNWSHGEEKVRINIEVGVSYGSDLDLVLDTLMQVAREHPKVMRNPESDVLFRGFGDSSWNMCLRVWIADPKEHPTITSEINCAIVRKFRENQIEIPYPQRDLHMRSPLPFPHMVTEPSES